MRLNLDCQWLRRGRPKQAATKIVGHGACEISDHLTPPVSACLANPQDRTISYHLAHPLPAGRFGGRARSRKMENSRLRADADLVARLSYAIAQIIIFIVAPEDRIERTD